MSSRQLPSSLLDCKPLPTAVDTPAAVYADSATGNGNGRSASCPDDVREMHKYYWESANTEGTSPTDAKVTVQHHQVPANQLPPELRHDADYSVATGSARLPPKLIPYGLPVCGDPAAGKPLTNVAANAAASEYYQTSAPTPGYMSHNDYVAYGYSPSHDMTSVMLGNAGYNHQTAPGYPCQRMSATSSPATAAQFADVKAVLPHGNTAELYQWVREQQQFAAANAIGIPQHHLLRPTL